MSGILGLWNLDGQPVQPELLSKMSATLAYRGPDGGGQWIDGPVGLACQLMRVTPESGAETQPLVSPSGTVVVFDGRLDNREELWNLLKGRAPGLAPNSPDPALVLMTYEAFGERFPEYLNGEFALGLFDPRQRRLWLAKDAVGGTRHLYYCQSGKTFLFASEVKALLAHPQVVREPNDDYLADWFVQELSCPQEGLTFFQDVFTLLPGHLAMVSGQGLVLRQYWDFDPTKKIRLGSFPEYAEAFRHLFEQAVRRRLRSAYPVGVTVSGGLDSSAVFCMAEVLKKEAGHRYPELVGVTWYCPDNSAADEEAYVKEIERKFGSSIDRVPTGDFRHVENPEAELWYSEVPYLESEDNHNLFRAARQRGARLILTGLGGDEFLSDPAYLMDLFYGLDWLKLRQHLKEMVHWGAIPSGPYGPTLLKKLITDGFPEPLVSWLRRVLHRPVSRTISLPQCSQGLKDRALRERHGPFTAKRNFSSIHAKTLYEVTRSANELFWMELGSKLGAMCGTEISYPFHDRDLLSFVMAVPGEIVNWGGVSKGILRAGLRGILPEAVAARRWKGDFTHLVNAAMVQDYPRVLEYLKSPGLTLSKGYVESKYLWKELEILRINILGPKLLIAKRLSCVLSLEAWLKAFFPDK